MTTISTVKSPRRKEDAVYEEWIPAGEGWMREIREGQVFRIEDVEGNEAADTLFFDAEHPEDHYSAVQTINAQQNVYVTTGTVLKAESGKDLLEVTADTVGRHDTLGGACSAQSNTVRYAHDRLPMHNCRDTFMMQLATHGFGTKRDISPNLNFFMNVPLSPEGGLEFDDGISGPGHYVEMKARTRTMALISNCPQLNNPCSGFNPTPLRVLIWDE
ncbi:urea amidolyase associated protein UAAP2 [Salibacterium sp. K-3]